MFLVVQIWRWHRQASANNPFKFDETKQRRPYELDQKERDRVIKQSFSPEKVPKDLDAIVIGSGLSGLSTAAILAKAGRKVLVLEQHDQAGGCCHTFVEKGYEFDVGVHYLCDFGNLTLTKFLLDQVSDGQIEWAAMEDAFDTVSIGYGENNKRYPTATGLDRWKTVMKEQFPQDHEAIDKFFGLIKEAKPALLVVLALKMIPLWLAKFVIKTGLIYLITRYWSRKFSRSCKEIYESLTDNKELQTVFGYIWGDYGVPPANGNFLIHAGILNAYATGAFYPIGGASEFAFNIIPVIERSGGRVLVRADVQEILHNGRKAMGVRIKKGSGTHDVHAPVVVSSAGIFNTFSRLLPNSVAVKSYFPKISSKVKPSIGSISVFVGLNASQEELGLKRENIWAFSKGTIDFDEFVGPDGQKAMEEEVPIMFVSFPSTKDPNWKLHKGRENKSTMVLITLASWEWYKKFKDTTLRKRGDEYEEMKNIVGHQMVEQACKLYPQVKHHIDYVEIGTPVTNNYYFGQQHGEVYGLDHGLERFDPWFLALARAETDVPGLYLTGQDIFLVGVTSALYSGALTASAVLERNVLMDLGTLYKDAKKKLKKSAQAKKVA